MVTHLWFQTKLSSTFLRESCLPCIDDENKNLRIKRVSFPEERILHLWGAEGYNISAY